MDGNVYEACDWPDSDVQHFIISQNSSNIPKLMEAHRQPAERHVVLYILQWVSVYMLPAC